MDKMIYALYGFGTMVVPGVLIKPIPYKVNKLHMALSFKYKYKIWTHY